MAASFRHLRIDYYDGDPACARGLGRYHVREHEIAGLIATETLHPPEFRIPKHAHSLPSFYVVVDGALTEICDRAERALDTCSVVFTPAGHIHSNAFQRTGGRCLLLELKPEWNDALASSGITLESPTAAERGELARAALRLYREVRYSDNVSPLAVESITLEMLAALAHQSQLNRDMRSWLRAARDMLHDRFADTITLAEIAAHAGMQPVTLARAFRRHYRCSPADYQRRLRIEHAACLLATTGMRLAEIAALAGFADQPHFSRELKRHTGMTPARFRATFSVHHVPRAGSQ